MQILTRLFSLQRPLPGVSTLLSNTRWVLLSEGAARLSRLVTVIVLAACLSSSDYGVAMLAIVCHELMRVFTRMGSGAKVIQCSDNELSRFAGNAIVLNWIICITLALIQFSLAPFLAAFYDKSSLQPLLQLMAVTYVIYPTVTVRVYLLQRNSQMKHFGLCSALAIITDNLITALLVWLGLGIFAVAIAKIVAALVWVASFLVVDTPKIKAAFSFHTMRHLLFFSSKVLSSELLKTLRTQADVLLAAKILAPEIFGIYSFAKSAGVGLGQSLSNAYLACVYPRLAQLQRDNTLNSGLYQIFLIALAISFIFICQSLAAPFYVPLLFNNGWENAPVLVMILCLSATPALFIDISALILRVKESPGKEIALQALSVLLLTTAIIISQPENSQAFASVVVITSFCWILIMPLFFIKFETIKFKTANFFRRFHHAVN